MSVFNLGLVASISDDDRALLVEALDLLLRERTGAHRLSREIAMSRGEREPDVCEFGMVDILRLSRKIAEGMPEADRNR
ncbi:hypothetical protein FAZ95_35655 [Trinickia violacea]|uniref:Uncharacterized protein n=1 Tax=Trinickia violacea TaxID=2571746 RepID=A0A4V1EIM6_9BURK|nr:hypothetical protein [Trinickia violacea]QCP54300.1 hypothetical protein FAZ95_35655 [Trinickia violacea]